MAYGECTVNKHLLPNLSLALLACVHNQNVKEKHTFLLFVYPAVIVEVCAGDKRERTRHGLWGVP